MDTDWDMDVIFVQPTIDYTWATTWCISLLGVILAILVVLACIAVCIMVCFECAKCLDDITTGEPAVGDAACILAASGNPAAAYMYYVWRRRDQRQ